MYYDNMQAKPNSRGYKFATCRDFVCSSDLIQFYSIRPQK